MARKTKNLHLISQSIDIETPDDNSTNFQFYTDFALLLSEKYGYNIRQGQSFRLRGVSVSLTNKAGLVLDNDAGNSVSAEVVYLPTTRHSVRAWLIAKKQWDVQRRISAKNGQSVKYDDFEVAFNTSSVTNRTSEIRAQGLGDNTSEPFILIGNSIDGTSYSLQDQFNSAYPVNPPSTDSFTGATVKDPKYSARYPSLEVVSCSANLSSSTEVEDAAGVPVTYIHGSNASNNIQLLPDNTHVNVLCGLTQVNIQSAQTDTLIQDADTVTAQVTYYVEGWSPLKNLKPRKAKPKKKLYVKRSQYKRRKKR